MSLRYHSATKGYDWSSLCTRLDLRVDNEWEVSPGRVQTATANMSLLLRRFRLGPTTTSARVSLQRVAAVGPRCAILPCTAVDPALGVTSISTTAPRTSTTTTLMTIRFLSQHGAKRGQHIQRLEEIATSQEHEAAVDRRRKKKEKETARKSGVGKASTSTTTHAAGADEHDDFDDDEDSDEEDDEDGPSLPDPKDIKERMQKQIEAFKGYLKSVRGSEPTPEMFDDISVADAYGKGTGLTPLKSVAQVVISSPTLATATCYVRLLLLFIVSWLLLLFLVACSPGSRSSQTMTTEATVN
jgi:hypothetical protein